MDGSLEVCIITLTPSPSLARSLALSLVSPHPCFRVHPMLLMTIQVHPSRPYPCHAAAATPVHPPTPPVPLFCLASLRSSPQSLYSFNPSPTCRPSSCLCHTQGVQFLARYPPSRPLRLSSTLPTSTWKTAAGFTGFNLLPSHEFGRIDLIQPHLNPRLECRLHVGLPFHYTDHRHWIRFELLACLRPSLSGTALAPHSLFASRLYP